MDLLTGIWVAAAPGSGGAPAWQLGFLALVYWGGTGAVVALVLAHRAGRTRRLGQAADLAGRVFGLPGWSALPVLVASVGLLLAMWAGVWDIGYHIDHGRDSGPLGNPAHVPLLLGLFLTFAAGVLAVGLASAEDASPAWVRIAHNWRAPLGGVLLVSCMAFGMSSLVLDDLWHRVFGQDVTLWSPTHFIFLFGGVLTVIGMLVLLKEGAIARPAGGGRGLMAALGPVFQRLQRALLLGGLLCGFELFLTEYDYGVPLYRQVWQPFLLAVFAGLVFTAARAWVGRGGAFAAWLSYAAIRLTGIVIPVLAGVSPSSMPLLVVEALFVEGLALVLDPRRRQLAFGATAGLLCGTIGFASEYAWSQIAMPLPWTTALLPEGLVLAAAGGVAGGVLGALLAASLGGRMPAFRVTRLACVGAFALIAVLGVDAATKHVPDMRAAFTLTDTRGGNHREAMATVRLDPPDAADHANWLYVLAWQGHAPRVADRLERIGPGIYRTTQPIPLSGSWKVGLRFNSGYARGAVPIRLPVDRGLPHSTQQLPEVVTAAQLTRAMRRSAGSELPAPRAFTRPFGDDNLIVLREVKGNVAHRVWTAGIALTVLIWTAFIVGLALGVGRMGRRGRRPRPPVPAAV
jgi:hypothetical protein